MNDFSNQAQRKMNELTEFLQSARCLAEASEFRDCNVARPDLGENAADVCLTRLFFTRFIDRFAELLSCTASEAWPCEDRECCVIDLLSELRHYSSHYGIDIERAHRCSAMHF